MDKKIELLLKKGILATDERPDSMGKKFEKYNIENSIENRKYFRNAIYSYDRLNEYIGGVILHKETYSDQRLRYFFQTKNILIGIKLDEGLKTEAGEHISQGIDDLDTEIKKYKEADFAKWRCLFTCKSSDENININCKIMLDYANICIKNNIIPIVEPEILWENYSIDIMENFAQKLYNKLLHNLSDKVILKCSFITDGKNEHLNIDDSAMRTVRLFDSYNLKIKGCVFLSGGHSSKESASLLKAVRRVNKNENFIYSYSFGRALTDEALEAYSKKDDIELAFKNALDRMK